MINKNVVLPTNEAIYLYVLSLGGPQAINDLKKRKLQNSKAIKIESKILNSHGKWTGTIPPCHDTKRYSDEIAVINKILSVVPLWGGGQEAIDGYLKHVGVLTESGTLRRWYEK